MPTGGARTRQQAVTVATLLAPPTEIAAAQAMTVIDEFAPDAAAGARAAVATWLRELYPGSDPPWVAPLRPDLLAEQLLATCAQLSDLVLAGYASIADQNRPSRCSPNSPALVPALRSVKRSASCWTPSSRPAHRRHRQPVQAGSRTCSTSR